MDSLLTVLEELNISYSFIDGDIVSVASATALQMNCPLIGSDPLFYIMSGKSSDEISGRLKFYPMSGMSFARIPFDDKRSSFFITGHLYNPSDSILSDLSPISCRIFAVLWGASSIPQLDLPQEIVESDMQRMSPTKIANTAIRLVNWLAEVGPVKTVETALSRIEDKEFKKLISESIPSSVNRTGFDVDEALRIIKELGLNPVLDLGGVRVNSSNGQVSSVRPSEGNLSHWPPCMLKAYRRGLICPFILSALYSETAKIFNCQLDYVTCLPSSYAKALHVRFLNYCLMYSFEKAIGGCAHLDRNNPKVIEIHPFNPDIVEISSIPLQCLELVGHELNSHFIYSCFSYISNTVLPGWLNILSLALLMWSKQSSNQVSPDESPIILAVAICALAQSFNSCEDPESVIVKYEEVCEEAQTEYESVDQESAKHEYDIPDCRHIIHNLVEIQNIYMELIALGKILKALNFMKSDRKNSVDWLGDSNEEYRPSYQIFPSNKLFYWITKCLYALPLERRRFCAIRKWFSQLAIHSVASNASQRFRTAVIDLTNMLDHLKRTEIQLWKTGQVQAQVPFSKVIEMTRSCADVHQTLESVLPVVDVPVTQPCVESQEESKVDCRAPKCKSEEEMENSGSCENHAKREKQSGLWSRRKVDTENLKMSSTSCPEASDRTVRSSTKRGRSCSNYAAILRRRVGIE
ncbi:hypothetical protein Aperf_G00000003394 [Anoplocephala perfoliata]